MKDDHEKWYRVLCEGAFDETRVMVHWTGDFLELSLRMRGAIIEFWQTSQCLGYFNGRIARLDSWRTVNGRLHLHLRPTDYRTLLYSNQNVDGIVSKWGENFLSRALGISAVVSTLDEQILLMQRSENVGEFPGFYDVFGGHIDVADDGLSPNVFAAMQQELQEELALNPEDYSLSCFGLLEAVASRKPELLFVAHCRQELEPIKTAAKSARDGHEYKKLVHIAAHQSSIEAFLRANGQQTSPSAFGCLQMYTAHIRA